MQKKVMILVQKSPFMIKVVAFVKLEILQQKFTFSFFNEKQILQ